MTTPGAQLQAMRPSRSVTCAHCGAVFTAKDTRAKWCSNRCRQANKYLKAKRGRDALRRDNVFIPDIKIEPVSGETACITSDAMDCEFIAGWDSLEKTLHELIVEYRELIEGGEISVPVFK